MMTALLKGPLPFLKRGVLYHTLLPKGSALVLTATPVFILPRGRCEKSFTLGLGGIIFFIPSYLSDVTPRYTVYDGMTQRA